jgi:argininosuccinate synthase
MFQRTAAPEEAPDEAEYVTIGFEAGWPAAVDGERLGPVALLERLNVLGGRHGVGRRDIVESRVVGMKSRGVYETPGGTMLYEAHRDLEALVLDRDTSREKRTLSERYAELVYAGKWFSPLREALDAFVDTTQKRLTGTVRLKLYKGSVTAVGRESPYSLFRKELVTFGRESEYDQADATGFIRLFGLPERTQGLVDRAAERGEGA